MVKFKEEEIRKLWSNGKTLTYKGKKYNVHKMSYGDYFLELENKRSNERSRFTDEEIWLEKVIVNHNIFYEIADN